MGNLENITATTFPKQGKHLGRGCIVTFHYARTPELFGAIVRDDMENPWSTIIRLDDGRYVLATECQYSPDVSVVTLEKKLP